MDWLDSVETNKRIFKTFSPTGSHTILVFSHTKRRSNISTRTSPLTVASDAGGVGKTGYSRPMAVDHDCGSANNNCHRPPCSLPHRPPRISEYCCSQPAWTTTTKRREQNLFVYSGKPKAEVTTEYCARRFVLLKLTTEKHEASKHRAASLRQHTSGRGIGLSEFLQSDLCW